MNALSAVMLLCLSLPATARAASEPAAAAARDAFESARFMPAANGGGQPSGRPLARSETGAYLFSPADSSLHFCSADGCRVAASPVTEVLEDGLGALFVLGPWGVGRCARGDCRELESGLAFSAKTVRSGGILIGTSEKQGTWSCGMRSCTRLTEAYFETWLSAFDMTGFWGSGPQGTWRCGFGSCRQLSSTRLEFLVSVGTPGGRGVAWGGERKSGTWRCGENACVSVGGLRWYNSYGFDDSGNLYGASGFPDSTYACSEAGCRKIDDRYRYFAGPHPLGGVVASTQIPEETHRCDLTGCEKTADGMPRPFNVIGPTAGGNYQISRRPRRGEARGTDGAVYAVAAKTEPRLERRAHAHAAVEILRDGTPLSFERPAPCWSWEYDEDAPSEWRDACVLY